ncbi:MAG: tripartite tricarboxylate transporter substrate-binding protein [Devosia sp.]
MTALDEAEDLELLRCGVSHSRSPPSPRLRAFAVAGDEHVSLLPDVPTMTEAGFPGVTGVTFNGVFAPKGTPPDIVNLLSEKIRAALDNNTPRESFTTLGSVATGSTPQVFNEFLLTETEKWEDIIAADVQP